MDCPSFPPDRQRLLSRCTFPPPGTDLVCGVSGGADSLALLVLACAAGCRVTAAHVDHGLRPGSAAEADVVADAARTFGARFVSLTAPVAPGANLEERARRARLAALPPGAATGHTADDQAETVLINLLRGAALDGLSGMRPGPNHPILALRRAETRSLCEAAGLEPVHDPSNDDVTLLRNRIRHELLPALSAAAGRDVAAVLSRQAAILAADGDLLESLSEAVDPTSVAALRSAPEPLARRALRRWLRDVEGHPPRAADIERVMAVARLEVRGAQIAGGTTVRRRAGRLYAEPSPPGRLSQRGTLPAP